MAIRSDRSKEFINESFVEYCEKKEIKHQPWSQQNGVFDRRNSSLIEMARTLLND